MTYYQDFTPCRYFDGNMGRSDWACRLIAIGWLEHPHAFTVGEVSSAVLEKLSQLLDDFVAANFFGTTFRGLQMCSLCAASGAPSKVMGTSFINLFIPHGGFVFVAPGGIHHYLSSHSYSPPEAFVSAVMGCPSPLTDEYRHIVRAANRGFEAPLYKDR